VSDLQQDLELTIQAKALFGHGETIVVAVSGGPDSMVLLHLLAQLAPIQQWKLIVAHFNHRLRGIDSEADQQFVRAAAAALRLPYVTSRGEVKKLARQQRLSIEMAARQCRHKFLAQAAIDAGAQKIALAHHADDQVELFFLRLLRGTGGAGLGGMPWANPSPANARVTLIRPLLRTTKAEILHCAARHRVAYRLDASNESAAFLRNRLRHEFIPLLMQMQPGLMQTIPRLMEIVRAEADYVAEAAARWLKHKRPAFDLLPAALQRRIIEIQLLDFGIDPEFARIETLREQAAKPLTICPLQTIVRTNSGNIRLRGLVHDNFKTAKINLDFNIPRGCAVFGGKIFRWQIVPLAKMLNQPIRSKLGFERFDAERIGKTITLRHWRPGDRFHPIGAPKPLKLQDFFTNAKVPCHRRRQLAVGVAADGRIFWVEGLRISECFKLDNHTRSVLQWHWSGCATK